MPNRSEETNRLMMDLLYGELSDTEAAEFEAKVADSPDLSAELDGYRRTREAFSALPDEEPPDRLTAILLHEAAKRAPSAGRKRAVTVEERPGWFEAIAAFFRPVVRHPAAMSMAALVLIVGVAGALYLRGMDTAHPDAKTNAPQPGAAHAPQASGLLLEEAPAASPPATEVAADGRFALGDETLAQDNLQADKAVFDEGAELGRNARLANESEEQALREQEKLEKKAPSKDAKQGYAYRSDIAPSAPAKPKGTAASGPGFKPDQAMANAVSGADPLAPVDDAESPEPTTAGKRENRAEGNAGRAGGEARDQQNAPTRQKSADNADRTADADDDFAGAARGASAAPPPSTDSTRTMTKAEQTRLNESRALHGQLRFSLDNTRKKSKKAKCQEAARIANDLLDKDRDYYYKKVAGSQELQPCASFVRQETERRARSRAAAKKKRRAKEAPAEADAFESAE